MGLGHGGKGEVLEEGKENEGWKGEKEEGWEGKERGECNVVL